MLTVFGDVDFWRQIAHAEALVLTLTDASYQLKKRNETLADAVDIFHNAFVTFSSVGDGNDALLTRLEKMWYSREQPLFVLGYYLHPKYREDALKLKPTLISNSHVVTEFAASYYRRFVGPRVGHLREEIDEWLCGGGPPVLMEDMASTPVDYWLRMQEIYQLPSLSRLAIAILSICTNTSPCDLPFSKHGPVHIPGKNIKEVCVEHKRQIMRLAMGDDNVLSDTPYTEMIKISPLESSLKTPSVLAEREMDGDPSNEAEQYLNAYCPSEWSDVLKKYLGKMDSVDHTIKTGSEDPDFDIPFDNEEITPALQGPLQNSWGEIEEEPKVVSGVRGLKVKLATLFGTPRP